ncbi:hypothetical protein [Halorarius halobius]|uniref:hypothetical protein n=1 Tax=Halorarius halobius TaxID=2962671 RepID=UPI0020CE6499|nr:hypothetical protein [Halorarius halobius]
MTEDNDTLGEMSHTNPYTNEAFGDTQTYNRGRTVAADGGEAGAAIQPREGDTPTGGTPAMDEAPDMTLREVDHTPPRNAPAANAAYMEGDENADE